LPRWTKRIRVTPGMAVEGPLDDGYSWRKYGQKDILGAMYPRYITTYLVLLCRYSVELDLYVCIVYIYNIYITM